MKITFLLKSYFYFDLNLNSNFLTCYVHFKTHGLNFPDFRKPKFDVFSILNYLFTYQTNTNNSNFLEQDQNH